MDIKFKRECNTNTDQIPHKQPEPDQTRRRNAAVVEKVKDQPAPAPASSLACSLGSASVSVRWRHMTCNNRFNLKNWLSIFDTDFYLNVRLKYNQNQFLCHFLFCLKLANTDEFVYLRSYWNINSFLFTRSLDVRSADVIVADQYVFVSAINQPINQTNRVDTRIINITASADCLSFKFWFYKFIHREQFLSSYIYNVLTAFLRNKNNLTVRKISSIFIKIN